MWLLTQLSSGSPAAACVRRIMKAGLTQAEIMKCGPGFHISDFTFDWTLGLYNAGTVRTAGSWHTSIQRPNQHYSCKIRCSMSSLKKHFEWIPKCSSCAHNFFPLLKSFTPQPSKVTRQSILGSDSMTQSDCSLLVLFKCSLSALSAL